MSACWSHTGSTSGERGFAWDFMPSGRTHGGRVALPFVVGGMCAPARDSRYVSGRLDWNNRQLYVTRGVGSIRGPRFNGRPEVTVLDLA